MDVRACLCEVLVLVKKIQDNSIGLIYEMASSKKTIHDDFIRLTLFLCNELVKTSSSLNSTNIKSTP